MKITLSILALIVDAGHPTYDLACDIICKSIEGCTSSSCSSDIGFCEFLFMSKVDENVIVFNDTGRLDDTTFELSCIEALERTERDEQSVDQIFEKSSNDVSIQNWTPHLRNALPIVLAGAIIVGAAMVFPNTDK